jgi:hypothetical protein
MDWHRSLRIVLRHEKKNVLTTLPNEPDNKADQKTKDTYIKH